LNNVKRGVKGTVGGDRMNDTTEMDFNTYAKGCTKGGRIRSTMAAILLTVSALTAYGGYRALTNEEPHTPQIVNQDQRTLQQIERHVPRLDKDYTTALLVYSFLMGYMGFGFAKDARRSYKLADWASEYADKNFVGPPEQPPELL
jgi:hypothetical protein